MRRKNNYKYLLILLLLVSVGYAAIATTLKINGSSQVKSVRWNVYWDSESIQVTDGSVATTSGNEARVTDAAKTQVEYSVELSEPGDFYEFTVDAVNEGSLNAKIAPNGVKNNVYESDGTTPKDLPDYIGYTVKYADDDSDVTEGDILEAKTGTTPTRKKYKVKVWYRTDIDSSALNDSTNETMKLMFEVDYVQGEKKQIIKPTMAEMCPGCVFAKNTALQTINEELSVETTNNYETLGNVFLGYTVENNIVKRAFVCGVNEEAFCIEGYTPSKFANNIDILNIFFSNCNANASLGGSSCSGTYMGAGTYDSGYVGGSSSDTRCYITPVGGAYCQINP